MYTLYTNITAESLESNFYLIPINHEFKVGSDEVIDFKGEKKYYSLKEIEQYQCTQEQALRYLQNNLKESFEQSKAAWQELQKFSKLTRTPIDTNEFQSTLGDILANISIEAPIDQGSLAQFINDFLPTEDLQGISQSAGNLIKDVIGDIAKDIPENPDDLEDWANQLHQKFFAKEEEERQRKMKEDIKRSVRESIAQRLRENGLDPL